jgi:nucleotide-binding universal stress UspA family protein
VPFFAHPSHADLPALLRNPARDVQPGPKPERILLPFDGSRAAQRALEHAIAKNASGRLHVCVVNVQPPLMAGDVTLFTSARTVEESRSNIGSAVLKPATSALQARRVAYTAHVALGDAAAEIAASAHRFGCTKIVMGTRGIGFLRSLWSRSVARRVVRLATVPVTLVKADATVSEGLRTLPPVPA